MKTWIGRLALLVVFALMGCGGGGGGDTQSTNPTVVVEGRVLNGVLVGSTVEVFGATGGSALGTATTDANGRFSVRVSQQGPYRLRAHGGKLNGADYPGILDAACSGGSICLVTPHSTVLARLVDEHGFNPGDAAGHLANSLGFAADPFAGGVPVGYFDLAAARQAIAGGDGLAAWVAGVVAWSTGENTVPPAGVGGSGPADLPPQPDPDPAPPPQPDPDPDPEPIPDPEPDPVVPVTHTVSTAAGAGGSIGPSSQAIHHGATATFTVMPSTGYGIATVSGCDGSLDGTTYTTGAITGACMVSATFVLNQYTLSYSAGPNGTLEGETVQTVSYGVSGTAVTAVPDGGYSFVEWSDASTANPRTDSGVTGDLSVTASFALNSYAVTATAGAGGSIDPLSQMIDHGDTATFGVWPEYGYNTDQVVGCNGTLDGNAYTTGAIMEACTIEASFALTSYTVSATAGTGGTISPASQVVNHGATATFTVTPETGYGIDWIFGCDGSPDGSTYTTAPITGSCSVNATFRVLDLSWSLQGGELAPATVDEPALYDLHERLILGADVNPSDISWSRGNPPIPEWLNLHPAPGLLSGTPSESDVGPNAFQVVAARIDGESRSTVYTIKVGRVYREVSQISGGAWTTCAVTTDGGAMCWGANDLGQFGNGDTANSNTPVDVLLPEGVTLASISTNGYHTCAVTADGGAMCWGDNWLGQLGNGNTANSNTPVDVLLPEGVTLASIGTSYGRTCAVTTDGGAMCWGDNSSGRLGNGNTANSNTPVDVLLPEGVTLASIGEGGGHTCAVTTDGGAMCWGWGADGQLGNGDTSSSSIPLDVLLPEGVTLASISQGGLYTCAVTTDSEAMCWGMGSQGQLGNGTELSSSIPVWVRKY